MEAHDRGIRAGDEQRVEARDRERRGAVGDRRARQMADVEEFLLDDPVRHRDREHDEPEQRQVDREAGAQEGLGDDQAEHRHERTERAEQHHVGARDVFLAAPAPPLDAPPSPRQKIVTTIISHEADLGHREERNAEASLQPDDRRGDGGDPVEHAAQPAARRDPARLERIGREEMEDCRRRAGRS